MEKYILGQSQIGRIRNCCEEVRLDVVLKENPYNKGTLIYGFVENISTGKAEANVCVICYSPCGLVLGQSFTNPCGLYYIPNIAYHQRYYLCAMKPGFAPNYSTVHDTDQLEKQSIDLYMCQTRPHTCTICGHVYNACFENISNAFVYLTNKGHHVVHSTITNQYGQFVCDKVKSGKYCISIEHRCYDAYTETIKISPKIDILPYHAILPAYC